MIAKQLMDQVIRPADITEYQVFSNMNRYRLTVLKNAMVKIPSNWEGFSQKYTDIEMRSCEVTDKHTVYESSYLGKVYEWKGQHYIKMLRLGTSKKYTISYIAPKAFDYVGFGANTSTLYCTIIDNKLKIKVPYAKNFVGFSKVQFDLVLTDPRDWKNASNEIYDWNLKEFPIPDQYIQDCVNDSGYKS